MKKEPAHTRHAYPTRRILNEFWRDIEWPVIVALALISLFLGVIGFSQYDRAVIQLPLTHSCRPDTPFTLWDDIYRSMQLLPMNSGDIAGCVPVPIALQIARFLLPAVTAYTFFKALLVIFRHDLNLLRLSLGYGHIIICGLGRKGYLLAKEYRQRHKKVVVIENNPQNSYIESSLDNGVVVLIGDARDPVMLRKAGVHRARELISVCGEDDINAEVATQVRRLTDKITRNLSCTIHVFNAHIWTQLRSPKFDQGLRAPFQLSFFNIFESGARILLKTYPPFDRNAADSRNPPHFLVIGLGYLAQCLVVHAARDWCQMYDMNHQQLRITVVDPDVESLVKSLKRRFPLVSEVCQIESVNYNTHDPRFHAGEFLYDDQGLCDITHVYICLDDAYAGLTAGLALLRQLSNSQAQIIVRMTENTGQAQLLQDLRDPDGGNACLHPFALFEHTCKPNQLDDGTREILAEEIHNAYLEEQLGKGEKLGSRPSLFPWDELSEGIKSANRDQAYNIGRILAKINYGITPWTEYRIEDVIFTPEEIEIMAIAEHERWMNERAQQGWRYGTQRNDAHKISPALLAWEKLPDNERAKDRETVAKFPAYLKRVGFRVYRLNAQNKPDPANS